MGFETGGGDEAGFDADGEAQNVSANRICHLNGSGGFGQIAAVARSAEVIEDNFVEHGNFVQRFLKEFQPAGDNSR